MKMTLEKRIKRALRLKRRFPAAFYSYLPDAICFEGIDKKKAENYPYGEPAECPKCKGYGYWVLTLNAYPGPHPHFMAGCSNCNGWGYVVKGSLDEKCIHEFHEQGQAWCRERGIDHYGMFCHVYECSKCGRVIMHDSSG